MLTRKHTWTALMLGVVGAVACDKPSTSDTSAPAQPAAEPASSNVTNTNAVVETTPDPMAGIANRDHIIADPNATNIDPPKDAVLVTGTASIVRESPRGTRTEVLQTTANVKEIQRDGDYYLIAYPDPKGSSKTYAGWVYKDSLVGEGWSPGAVAGSPQAVAGTPKAAGKLGCARGESHLRTTGDFCGKTCTDDRDCASASGEICDGLAFKVNETTNGTSDARYCISDRAPSANKEHAREHGSSSNLPVHK
jgi:hypothetical protein